MKSGAALLSLIIVLGIGYYMYRPSIEPSPGEKISPIQQVDVTGVKSDLLSIAQAERLYLTGHSTYGTLEELEQDGSLSFSGRQRRGYNYVAEINGASHFKITATPADPAKTEWPTLSIDDTMTIAQH
jgi:Tfp pilus assembly protein PilE